MAARARLLLGVVFACGVTDGSASQSTVELNANPIRRVVTLLQNMQKQVEEEGEKEKVLFEKFMCYCKTGTSDLQKSIGEAETKVPQVQASINEGVAQKSQLQTELKNAQKDREEANKAMATATALRVKQAKVFKSESSEYKSNIAALTGAIKSVSKGMSGSFVQTNTANIVRNIAMTGPNMEDADRQELLSFLDGGHAVGYAPQGGQIAGILKAMKDSMMETLHQTTKEEASAISDFDELESAKNKEVNSLTKAIETKSKRIGDVSVEIASLSNDLDDTSEALAQDRKFLGDLKTNCAAKEEGWEGIQKLRSQELVAIGETVKILNDDDALDLFKKTLPSATGFLQLAVSGKSMKKQALDIIKKEQSLHPSVNLRFVQLALQAKSMGFGKVVNMVDNMVGVLKKEQVDDETKKGYCMKQLDESGDKAKGLELTLKDLGSVMADQKESIKTLNADIKALGAGIQALDKNVAEATQQRREENADYKELKASDSSAKEVLNYAKNRLNKFYNPRLHKAAPRRNLGFQQLFSLGMLSDSMSNMNNDMGGVSFAQVAQHSRSFVAPGEAPEAPGSFRKKSESSTGVIAMIDLLIRDLDMELQEADHTEKQNQKEYQAMMSDAKEKRAEDTKMITVKETAKAQLETELEASKDSKAATTKELVHTRNYISGVHKECDWLLKHFSVRKEARANEIDALGKAKSVLNGADYGAVLMQTGRFLKRRA